jgi:hypothetical protein
MYGIVRCPRCGGHRLVKPSSRGIMVICTGCGLNTAKSETPPAAGGVNIVIELESVGRRQICTQALPVCVSGPVPRGYP